LINRETLTPVAFDIAGKTVQNHHKDLSEEGLGLQDISQPNTASMHETPDSSKMLRPSQSKEITVHVE
jgi:hypothetical protein